MSAENVFDRQGVAFVVDRKPVWKAMKMDRFPSTAVIQDGEWWNAMI